MTNQTEKLARALEQWGHDSQYELAAVKSPAEWFTEILEAQGLAIVPLEPDSDQMNSGAIELRHQSVQTHSLQHKAAQTYKAMLAARDEG